MRSRMAMFLTLLCILPAGYLGGQEVGRLAPDTYLPSAYEKVIGEKTLRTALLIPPGVVRVAQVKLIHAELREGPGPQFKVKDSLLTQSQWLLLFQRIGAWQFAIEKTTGISGWIHEQAIGPTRLNRHELKISASYLPVIFSATNVAKARNYPKKQSIKVEIPKGIPFKTLRLEGKEALVWLKETNSLVWLPQDLVY